MTDTSNVFREECTGEVCPACGEARRVRYVPWFSPWSERAERARPMPCACGRREIEERAREDTARGFRLIREDARQIAGIPEEFRAVSLAKLTPEAGQEAAAALLADFAARFREERHMPGVMLLGGTGRGKSCFAAAAANTVIDEYPVDEAAARDCGHRYAVCHQHRIVPVRFASIAKMLHTMRSGIRAGHTDVDETEARMKRVPLLVLDDLGAERLSEFAAEVLFRIIDHRECCRLPVIVTSNLATPEAMRDHLGERIFSRINGMCRPVALTCGDMRAAGAV